MKPIIKDIPSKTRRKFDETFKRESVNNWLTSVRSAEVIAEELGLTSGLLYSWRKLLPPAAAGGESGGGGQAGLGVRPPVPTRPRPPRDPAPARAARHSKKTLGILSEPSPSALNGSTR